VEPVRAGPERGHVLQLRELPVLRARRHPRAGLGAAALDPPAQRRRVSVLERRPAAGHAEHGTRPRPRVPPREDRAARRLGLCSRRLGDAHHPRPRPRHRRARDDVSAVISTARVSWYAIVSGANDYFAIFTLKSWVFGWFLRMISQVTFF